MSAEYEDDEEEYEEVEDDEEVVEDDSAPGRGPSRLKIAVIGLIAVIVVTNLVTAIVLWRLSKSRDEKAEAPVIKSQDKGGRLGLVVPPSTPREKPSTRDAVAPPPEKPTTEDIVAPPPEKPSTRVAVAPPPKKPSTKDAVTPPAEKPSTKAVVAPPPKAGPLELRPAVAGTGTPLFPASDDGQKMVFDTGPFHAVLAPPEELGRNRALRVEPDAGNPDALLVKHLSKSGFGHELLLTCKRQGGQMVWEINKASEASYAACLQHLVLSIVKGTGAEQAVVPCLRKRNTEARDLVLTYRADGSAVGKEEERVWSLRYPWVEALSIQHKALAGGKPVPLGKGVLVSGGDAEARRDAAGRLTEVAFRRTVQAPGDRAKHELACVLSFSIGSGRDPKEGAALGVAFSARDIEKFLKSLKDARAALEVLRGHHREFVRLTTERDQMARRLKNLRDLAASGKYMSSTLREELEDLEKENKAQFGTRGEKAKRIEALSQLLVAHLARLKRDTVPSDWGRQIDEEQAALGKCWALPQEQFKGLEAVTVLDPWGLPLAILTPKLQLQGAEELESPKARPSAPSKEKSRF